MANTVIALRQSGATGNTPSLGVLANGELSLNYADSILYFKTSSNTLGSIRTTQPAGLTTEIQFNDAGSFGTNSTFNFNKTTGTLNVKNINVSTNLTATSITTGSGAGGTIAGANVIYSNIFVANSTTTSISNSTGAIISNGGLGVKGNVYADAIYDGGVEVIVFAQAAFNQSNSANVLAQASFNKANSANLIAQAAFDKANTLLANTGTLITVNSASQLYVSNTTTSTSNITGALTVAGGIGVAGNVYASNVFTSGDVVAGLQDGPVLTGATNPIFAAIGNTNSYIQNYVVNYSNTSNASADWAAYPNNGNDTSGWIDMGITSNNYSQSGYNTTGRNEGYLLMSAPANSGTSGNLIIATDVTGIFNSIEHYPGGFNSNKGNSVLTITTQTSSTSNTTGGVVIKNGLGVKGNVYADAVYTNNQLAASLADVLALSIALG